LISLFVVTLFIASGVELLPGDLAETLLGQDAEPDTVAAFRKEIGLDLPFHIRYFKWLGGVLVGDFGHSLANSFVVVSELIGTRVFNTLFLAVMAASIAVPIGLTLGVLAALYRTSVFDRTINVVNLTWVSFPDYFIGYVLILFLAIHAGIFPSISNIMPEMTLGDRAYRTLLPAVTMSLASTAHIMRMTRAAIINLLASPYIEMARLKGLSPTRIIVKHALPNAIAPIANVVVINLAYLVVGVVITEVVFVYPGLGQLLIDSVTTRDIPVVQAAAMIFAGTYILLNLLADILSIISNPLILHPRQ
jgi:peptide/nickel transport system permease protein